MRALLVVFGSSGLLLGLACAVTAHFLPVGEFGWFAYTPLGGARSRTPTISITPDWLPALWVLPLVGLAAGSVVAVVLHRTGWRLGRPG